LSNFVDNTPLVTEARIYANGAHGDQKYDGLPYVLGHLDLVVEEVLKYSKDPVVLTAAYLHDVLKDTEVTRNEMWEKFGKTITDAVECLTDGKGDTRFERQLVTYAKCRDNRISLVVKLCDRTVNMRKSFGSIHAITYVNEYERFKGSLYSINYQNECSNLWKELDALYKALKNDIQEKSSEYLKLISKKNL
jgi:(p)ppGpp synthase/HD superfamily hydrolase